MRQFSFSRLVAVAFSFSAVFVSTQASAQTHRGYYTDPAVHGDTLIFTSEGDLWSVPVHGGAAHRLTSGSGAETGAKISPDGQTVAFRAHYEGPADVYTIPVGGGLPHRWTWDGDATPEGWTPDGRVIVNTGRYATLPQDQLVLVGSHGESEPVALASASEAVYSTDGRTLFFTRWAKQPSHNKRYQGGEAENLWRFDGKSEATAMTADFKGTSHAPMFANGRVYFLSDRDGVMNVYSMDEQGHDVKQVSHQKTFDIESAAIDGGVIVYSCAADLWSLDVGTGHEEILPITLVSDFDQLREHWVTKPAQYISSAHIAPDGSAAVFTARGEVFTLAPKNGRIVKVAGESATRFRDARFLPNGKSVLTISTQTGETEFWKYPANGEVTAETKPEEWTKDAKVLRWDGITSPDGKYLAHYNKDQQLWLFDTKTKQDKLIRESRDGDFGDLSWSPDSRWLAFTEGADNQMSQVKVLNVASGAIEPLTSDRYNSMNAAWSSDGKWIYFLSDRNLKTTVQSPWGPRMPAPHFDRTVRVYEMALNADQRSPFLAPDELHPESKDEKKKDDTEKQEKKDEDKKKANGKPVDKGDKDTKTIADEKVDAEKKDDKKIPEVKIDFNGIEARLNQVPVGPGNYGDLQAAEKRLCWINADDSGSHKTNLQCLAIDNKGDEPDTVMGDVKGFEISQDRKKMLLHKDDDFWIVDSDAKGSGLGDAKVLGKAHIDLSHWTFSTIPQDEYRGYFLDAWRLERDYYYDRHMQGVNWPSMRDRYLPLVDRVSNREELNDVIGQMVSELSTLHTFVRGGDVRKPEDHVDLGSFGAKLRRDEKAGGFVVEHVYGYDPDLPEQAPPFAQPQSMVKEGDVITSIDGVDTLSVTDERELLRDKAHQPVLLHVKPAKGEPHDVLVKPVSADEEADLRYNEWEYSRREKVEADSSNTIGYVHLRAMGANDIDQWARDYYPVFKRQGLIIDVRHNHGGNIDSWLLSTLLRKAWFYWQPRVGDPDWNMQGAFRGHIVVLIDEETASDGEAFAEGFKHFELGKVIGTRTWGGEIWLSGANVQADHGVATAAETGVYSADGRWLIEGHGVDPDITVDNLPHDTFEGHDAQLQSAIDLLKKEIQEDPRPVPHAPAYPDKSFQYK